jgi:hypothetical protein
MSSDADTRVVAFRSVGTPSGTLSASYNLVTYPAASHDTHGAYSSGTYTVPVAGYYDVAASFTATAASISSGEYVGIALRKNGNATAMATSFTRCIGTGNQIPTPLSVKSIYCNAGDTLAIYSVTNYSTPSFTGALASTESYFTVHLVSGPAQIAASETVAMRANTSTTTISGSVTTLLFTSTDFDTHGGYASGTGLYTVQSAGLYRVKGVMYLSTTSAVDGLIQIYIYKNASTAAESVTRQQTASSISAMSFPIDTLVRAVAGDTFSIRASTDRAAPTISSSRCYFEVQRVGNY